MVLFLSRRRGFLSRRSFERRNSNVHSSGVHRIEGERRVFEGGSRERFANSWIFLFLFTTYNKVQQDTSAWMPFGQVGVSKIFKNLLRHFLFEPRTSWKGGKLKNLVPFSSSSQHFLSLRSTGTRLEVQPLLFASFYALIVSICVGNYWRIFVPLRYPAVKYWK